MMDDIKIINNANQAVSETTLLNRTAALVIVLSLPDSHLAQRVPAIKLNITAL